MTVRLGMGVFYTTSQARGHIGLARLYWKVCGTGIFCCMFIRRVLVATFLPVLCCTTKGALSIL